MALQPKYPRTCLRRTVAATLAAFAAREFEMERCEFALKFTAFAHAGQVRSSDGSPFILHPLAVAQVLTQWGWPEASVLGGILHDVIEDSAAKYADIAEHFGSSVADIVMACTKNGELLCSEKRALDLQARVMQYSLNFGPAVALVKLVDRAHNLSTSSHLSAVKRQRLADETAAFYGPLANTLGMTNFGAWLLKPNGCHDTPFVDLMAQFNDEANPLTVTRHYSENIARFTSWAEEGFVS